MSERVHAKVPGSGSSENAYLGACWCQPRDGAWPCHAAARPPAPALSEREAAIVAVLEAAPVPEEILALHLGIPLPDQRVEERREDGMPEGWIDADWTYYS